MKLNESNSMFISLKLQAKIRLSFSYQHKRRMNRNKEQGNHPFQTTEEINNLNGLEKVKYF